MFKFRSLLSIRIITHTNLSNQLSPEVVEPNLIPDHHTTHEAWQDIRNKINKHEIIDQKLLDYQERLDETRERLDDDELTQEEFDELKDGIEKDMPIEVRRKLPDYDPSQETALQSDFTATVAVEQATKLVTADMSIDPAMLPSMK